MKRIIIILPLFLIIIFTPSIVFASDSDYASELSQYDLSSFEKLGDDTNDILEQLGLDDFDYSSITSLSFSECLKVMTKLIGENIKTPLKSISTVLCFVILSALFSNFSYSENLGRNSGIYSTASSLVIAAVIAASCSATVSLVCTTISVCGDFVYAFVPAFFAIIVASGGGVTSISTNSMLLILSQGLNFLSANIFVPLINCFLALGICSGLRNELNVSGFIQTGKRIIISLISISAGIFVSVLSLKTAVASRADALGLRSMRFAINSVVPVIGSAISEGLLSIQSYSGLVKSSVGIVGIVAVFALFLPALINVLLWRLSMYICSAVSNIFDDMSVSKILNAFSDMFLLMNVILILSMVTTIISFGILIAAKTGAN